MKSKEIKAFTLAEVLITLAIIGVVAVLSIPAVISNSQQQEYKTGLRKAVSALNSAITVNMVLDGESPYDNANLFGYLMKHMSVLKSTTHLETYFANDVPSGNSNSAFYTTDGMRFEIPNKDSSVTNEVSLYENDKVAVCASSIYSSCNGCGSYGLNSNPDNKTKPPCLIMVDVNGDRKPNPANINCKDAAIVEVGDGTRYCGISSYKTSDPLGSKLTDVFSIMITDRNAIPYGIAAQKAMYQARK